jgi:hypothetical protein
MSQPVSALDGIGPLAAEVFTQAGYVTVGELKAFRTEQPITVAELYPNRTLLIAQDYHRKHHLKLFGQAQAL